MDYLQQFRVKKVLGENGRANLHLKEVIEYLVKLEGHCVLRASSTESDVEIGQELFPVGSI